MNLDTIILFIFATTPSTKASSKVRTHVLQNMVQEDGLEVHGNLRARLTYRIIMQNLGKSSRNQIREEANGSTSRGQLLGSTSGGQWLNLRARLTYHIIM